LVTSESTNVNGRRGFEVQLAHVRDVEEPGGFAHGVVLVHDAGILHGQLPAAEGDDSSAERFVLVEQGRASKGGLAHEWARRLARSSGGTKRFDGRIVAALHVLVR
jgi:hypothetical protein